MSVASNWFLTKVLTSRGQPGTRPWITIGNFDGCHGGHQTLFREVGRISGGAAIAVTFFPHPVEVFGGDAFYHIDALSYRIKKMLAFGFAEIWVVHFTPDFANVSWQKFLETIVERETRAAGLCVGEDFVLGHDRAGTVDVIAPWLAARDIVLEVVPKVTAGERRISSRWVRDSIRGGDFQTVVRRLKCDYALSGVVQKCARLGHTLGAPTANIFPSHYQLLPPHGVYVGSVEIDARHLPCVVNIGRRPTVTSDPDAPVVVEAHVLDFNESIYGRYLEVRLLKRLREERTFDGMDALRVQIARDIETTRAYIADEGTF